MQLQRWVWLLCLPAMASMAGETVTIGGQEKRATGKLISAQAGDVACYLELEDENGEPFSEMAEFELCEAGEELWGEQVRLEYVLGNVIAEECQGNPDCGKSDEVALVRSATPIAAAPAQSVASFCTAGETVVYSCDLGSKRVSVCASAGVNAQQGYVQYRFGKPGQPLEMETPKRGNKPDPSVYGRSEAFAGGGGAWIRFSKGDHAYVVFSGIGRWGENGETMEKAGVVVEKAGKQIAYLKCDGALTSELGPEWFESAGFSADREDEFYFPD